MILQRKNLLAAGVALLLSMTSLVAANVSAKSIMQNAFKYVQSMDRYAFDASIVDEIKDGTDTVKYRSDLSIKVDRPNKLRVDKRRDGDIKRYILNNGRYIMLDHSLNFYTEVEVPKSIDEALDYLFKKYDISAPLSSLIYSDMKKRTQFRQSKNFGIRKLNGVECNYIGFKDRAREIHVWVATGDKPFVQAYSIIERSQKSYSRTDTFIQWRADEKIVDSDFVYDLPKQAIKIPLDDRN